MRYSAAKTELDVMQHIHDMPCTFKELVEQVPYSRNQVLWVLNNLRSDGLIIRIQGTHLMQVVSI